MELLDGLQVSAVVRRGEGGGGDYVLTFAVAGCSVHP